jgi:CxxC-x17-CxxC domain-containing protein
MSFQDKSILCCDCGTKFNFTATEQEYYQSRGYTNDPKRCQSCRSVKPSQRLGNNNYNSNRPMFATICSECGKDTSVPFEPSEGRPVYCSECYSKIKVNR